MPFLEFRLNLFDNKYLKIIKRSIIILFKFILIILPLSYCTLISCGKIVLLLLQNYRILLAGTLQVV